MNDRIVEVAKALTEKCTETEYWYKSKYCTELIEKALLEVRYVE